MTARVFSMVFFKGCFDGPPDTNSRLRYLSPDTGKAVD